MEEARRERIRFYLAPEMAHIDMEVMSLL